MTLQQQIQHLGEQIMSEFKARLGEVRLSPEEALLAQRISNRLAEVAIRLPGALPEDQARLLLKRDAALASLANIGVAQAVKAERLMRQSVLNVVTKLLQIGFGILAAP